MIWLIPIVAVAAVAAVASAASEESIRDHKEVVKRRAHQRQASDEQQMGQLISMRPEFSHNAQKVVDKMQDFIDS